MCHLQPVVSYMWKNKNIRISSLQSDKKLEEGHYSYWPCSSLSFHLHLSYLSTSPSPVPSLFTPGLYSWLFVSRFCFSKVPSLPPFLPPFCAIYHSLSPSHLSLLPSLFLSLHCFSSGSPLIKPLCLLPPCPVSTHTSHTSLSHFLLSVLSLSIFLSCTYASFLILMLIFFYAMLSDRTIYYTWIGTFKIYSDLSKLILKSYFSL